MHAARMFAVVAFFIAPLAHAQDAKPATELTPEATAKILQELKIEFNKTASKKGDEHYFEFTRNSYRIRLTQFSPTELMLDCVFRGIPLDKVNEWNQLSRFAHVSLHRDASGDVTLLAYSLDVAGGVTAATVQQFLNRFDDELKKYDRFIPDDTILTAVTAEKIESILKSQGIQHKKTSNSKGVPIFDFELNGQKLRLYNFDGKDLMMDAQYRRIELEHVNRYNLNKKFIRVVNYRDPARNREYTAVETNLDCEAGVTESMIRHWIVSFSEDAQDFAEYARKLGAVAEKQ